MEPLAKKLPTWIEEQNKTKKAKGVSPILVSNLVPHEPKFLGPETLTVHL